MTTSRHTLTGDDFGAIAFSDFKKLYAAQGDAVRGILTAIHGIARNSYERGPYKDDASLPLSVRDLERPHHSFLINGVRGRGKTTTLVTLHAHLARLCLDPGRMRRSSEAEIEIANTVSGFEELEPVRGPDGNKFAGLVIPVVFSEDMEDGESPMDAVLALMQREIEIQIEAENDSARRLRLERLRKDLKQKVTTAWAFARGVGHQTLAQDALDYEDYVSKRADLNRSAYGRIHAWHAFLREYLDVMGYELLIVLFDDTDLDDRLAMEILSVIRIYLAHPRAASVLAADMDSLPVAIQAASLNRSKAAIEAFALVDDAEAFIETARDNALAMVDKVLPPALRWQLGGKGTSFADSFFPTPNSTTGPVGYILWCRGMAESRPEFASAWWLLAYAYRRLVAATPRRLVNFRRAVELPDVEPIGALWRFAEIYGHAAAVDYELLGDEIEAQGLIASWPTNDDYEEEEEGGGLNALPPVIDDFVDLWIDCRIAENNLDARRSGPVRAWLPRELRVEPFTSVDEALRLPFGVAGVIGGGALPRNCLYLHNFRRLAPVVAERLPAPSRWVEVLDSLDEDDLAQSSVVERLLVEIADIRATDTRSLIEAKLASAFNVSRGGGSRTNQRVIQAALLLYGVAAKKRGGPLGATIAAAIKSGLSDMPNSVTAFIEGLSQAMQRSERSRQEALFTWACALEVARPDEVDLRATRFFPRNALDVSFEPYTEGVPRIRTLALETLRLARLKNRRSRLLLWSVAPLLKALHDFGSDYTRRAQDVEYAWSDLEEAFAVAANDPVDHDFWTYPDISPDILGSIDRVISETKARFSTDLSRKLAAGAPVSKKLATNERLLAELLGTSVAWVETNLDVSDVS